MFERFKNITYEEKQNLTFDNFTVSELKTVIDETVLSQQNKEIAEMRFIKVFTIKKIAEKLLLDERTVHSRISQITKKLKDTILKII